MSTVKTLVINLDRCQDRWNAMKLAFPSENLIRLKAIDCRDWESGKVDRFGKPQWKLSAWDRFIDDGTISKKAIYNQTPGGVANYLSHAQAWKSILWSGLDGAIVLEDDVRPSEHFEGFDNFDPCGRPVVFLYGADVEADATGKLTKIKHVMGYYISREACKIALQAMRPMYLQSDLQWFAVAFKDFYFQANIQDIEVEKHNAYVQKDFWLQPSEHATETTWTRDGRKPWRE